MRSYLTVILFFFCLGAFSQESKVFIKVEGQELIYNLKRCYKRGKLLKTDNGLQVKIVVWNGYANWSKKYRLIVRSIGGKYSTSILLENLVDNVEINFEK